MASLCSAILARRGEHVFRVSGLSPHECYVLHMSLALALVMVFLLLFVLLPLLALVHLAWRFLHDNEQVGGSSWGKQIGLGKRNR